MIVSSPRSARRSRAPRGGWIALVTAIAALLVTVSAALAAPATATAPAPAPSPTPSPGTLAFTLSPVGNGVVRPGDGLAVSVTLQNATASPAQAADVTLALGDQPLAGRAALTAWLAGDGTGLATRPVGTAFIDSVAPGDTEATGILVPSDDPALAGRAPGVYPLVASYATPFGIVSSTSAMIVPDGASTVGVGLVAPITAAPRAVGLLTADELAELTAPGGSLTTQLDAVEGTAAILAIDPAIPAAIRVLGSSAPASATAWLGRLTGLSNPRFALQFGDADPAVQIDAGLPRPQRPLSLAAFMDPVDFAVDPSATPAPSPSQSTDPTVPVLPDLDDLTDVGSVRPGVFWPAASTATASAVAVLGGLETDDLPSLTLLSSSATVSGAAGESVAAHASIGTADALVYDADVSRELSEAAELGETSLRGASLTAATAYLSFAAADSPGAPVLVALDRATDRSRVGLRTAVAAALQGPGAIALDLEGLADAPAVPAQLVELPVDEAAVAQASALFADENDLARFATILDDPRLLTGPERADILQLLAVPWLALGEEWYSAVAAHRAETATTIASVELLPTPTINLFGSGAGLWFTVRNDLPYPVNLVLYATPDDLRLDVQRASPFVATAASNTRVEVPVQARVGNGEVTLALQLRSRASVAIGDPQTVQVNVRAEWETFGLVALGIVVAGLLVVGVFRTVKQRRARAAARREAADPEDPR